MDIKEYKTRIIERLSCLSYDQYTAALWEEVAQAILESSGTGNTPLADALVGIKEEPSE